MTRRILNSTLVILSSAWVLLGFSVSARAACDELWTNDCLNGEQLVLCVTFGTNGTEVVPLSNVLCSATVPTGGALFGTNQAINVGSPTGTVGSLAIDTGTVCKVLLAGTNTVLAQITSIFGMTNNTGPAPFTGTQPTLADYLNMQSWAVGMVSNQIITYIDNQGSIGLMGGPAGLGWVNTNYTLGASLRITELQPFGWNADGTSPYLESQFDAAASGITRAASAASPAMSWLRQVLQALATIEALAVVWYVVFWCLKWLVDDSGGVGTTGQEAAGFSGSFLLEKLNTTSLIRCAFVVIGAGVSGSASIIAFGGTLSLWHLVASPFATAAGFGGNQANVAGAIVGHAFAFLDVEIGLATLINLQLTAIYASINVWFWTVCCKVALEYTRA